MEKFNNFALFTGRAFKNALSNKPLQAFMLAMAFVFATPVVAFAAGGLTVPEGQAGDFVAQVFIIIRIIIIGSGAIFALLGGVALAEGFSDDNPAAKSKGGKQLVSGAAIILLGLFVVPMIEVLLPV